MSKCKKVVEVIGIVVMAVVGVVATVASVACAATGGPIPSEVILGVGMTGVAMIGGSAVWGENRRHRDEQARSEARIQATSTQNTNLSNSNAQITTQLAQTHSQAAIADADIQRLEAENKQLRQLKEQAIAQRDALKVKNQTITNKNLKLEEQLQENGITPVSPAPQMVQPQAAAVNAVLAPNFAALASTPLVMFGVSPTNGKAASASPSASPSSGIAQIIAKPF
jgi:hypothetical protein